MIKNADQESNNLKRIYESTKIERIEALIQGKLLDIKEVFSLLNKCSFHASYVRQRCTSDNIHSIFVQSTLREKDIHGNISKVANFVVNSFILSLTFMSI